MICPVKKPGLQGPLLHNRLGFPTGNASRVESEQARQDQETGIKRLRKTTLFQKVFLLIHKLINGRLL